MIIKHPSPQHKAGLSALWQEAFNEPKESPETFFATAYSPDRSMVCLEEDQVVSALYWFDCLWGDKKVAYIYAVATLLSHRGQGLCNQLMAKTHEHLKEKGYFGAILVPAEDSLFPFYSKMGYLPCCPGAIPPEKYTPCHCEGDLSPVAISMEEYLEEQKSLLPKDAVLHTPTAYQYLKHFGEFYKTEKGILCKTEEEVQEVLPYTPGDNPTAMYLPLTGDKTLPSYFALPLA